MSLSKGRLALVAAAAVLAASACNGNNALPSGQAAAASSAAQVAQQSVASPVDTTSILKKLTKDVVIGTTVDPTNGDQGPHSLSIVTTSYGLLSKGQLVVCNFEDKTGAAGAGTTIDLFDPTPGSKPTTFTQSSDAEGCDSSAISKANGVYAGGFTSHVLAAFTDEGKLHKTYGSPLEKPFSDVDASNSNLYQAEYIFTSDAKTGGIVSFSINNYGNPKPLQVADGFAVNREPGWGGLGPSGLAYDSKKNVLYIADGVDSTVVSFNNASDLLVENEIEVEKGGKTFKCKYEKTTCGTVVKAGSPLDAPEAMTILPNGNLIAANTAGGNTLVEMTPTGQVLDTKVVDTSKTAGIFGLVASGTNDDNTVLFFTDKNSNTLQELEP